MTDRHRAHPIDKPPASWSTARPFTTAIELWRFRGASDDLRGLAIRTSFGDAFGLELAGEVILLFLQPSRERLIAYADRVKTVLLQQGWRVIRKSVSAAAIGKEDA
jgi:hypothetical protein